MKAIDIGMTTVIATILVVATMFYSVTQHREVRQITQAELTSLIYSRKIQSADWKGTELIATLEDGDLVEVTLPRQGSNEGRSWDSMFFSQNVTVRRQ